MYLLRFLCKFTRHYKAQSITFFFNCKGPSTAAHVLPVSRGGYDESRDIRHW